MSEQFLDQILSELKEMNQLVEKIDTEQQRQGEHIHQLIQIVGSTNAELQSTNAKLESTNAKLEGLATDMKQVQSDVATLKKGQKRQDRILESLALHSLEQETIIRELKRIK